MTTAYLLFTATLAVTGAMSAITPSDTFEGYVTSQGFPVERHTVLTADNYNLTLFRLPSRNGTGAPHPLGRGRRSREGVGAVGLARFCASSPGQPSSSAGPRRQPPGGLCAAACAASPGQSRSSAWASRRQADPVVP